MSLHFARMPATVESFCLTSVRMKSMKLLTWARVKARRTLMLWRLATNRFSKLHLERKFSRLMRSPNNMNSNPWLRSTTNISAFLSTVTTRVLKSRIILSRTRRSASTRWRSSLCKPNNWEISFQTTSFNAKAWDFVGLAQARTWLNNEEAYRRMSHLWGSQVNAAG